MKRQSVLCGSVWLIGAAVAAKLLGAVFRLPLTAMLGGAGMGYFSCAYGLFLPVFALSVTGINTAVSVLTAQALAQNDPQTAGRLGRIALRMFGIGGAFCSLLLFLAAESFCGSVLRNPQAALSVHCLAPAVWFCCINAVLRGQCEGRSSMMPTAVSQVAEGIGRAVCGLGLCGAVCRNSERILRYLPAGTTCAEAASAAAILGVTLSTAAGTAVLLLLRPKGDAPSGLPPVFRQKSDRRLRMALWRTLLPVSAASLVTNLTGLIDLALGLRLLAFSEMRAGASAAAAEETANFLFGAYSGFAVTVFNLVPAVTNMFGKGVFPAFAESYARHRTDETAHHAETVMQRTALLAFPAGCGLAALAEPVLTALFPARPAECAAAAPALQLLGIAVIFTALGYPLFSMLQAAGHAGDTVTVMLAGGLCKLLCNLLLIPPYGLRGAAISTAACYAVILLLACRKFRRRTGIRLPLLRLCLRHLYAGLLCGAAALAAYGYLPEQLPQRVLLLIAAAAGGTIWLTASLLLRPRGSFFRHSGAYAQKSGK